ILYYIILYYIILYYIILYYIILYKKVILSQKVETGTTQRLREFRNIPQTPQKNPPKGTLSLFPSSLLIFPVYFVLSVLSRVFPPFFRCCHVLSHLFFQMLSRVIPLVFSEVVTCDPTLFFQMLSRVFPYFF